MKGCINSYGEIWHSLNTVNVYVKSLEYKYVMYSKLWILKAIEVNSMKKGKKSR
jgi:hypothetical protein